MSVIAREGGGRLWARLVGLVRVRVALAQAAAEHLENFGSAEAPMKMFRADEVWGCWATAHGHRTASPCLKSSWTVWCIGGPGVRGVQGPWVRRGGGRVLSELGACSSCVPGKVGGSSGFRW